MGPLLKLNRWDLALKSRGAKPQNQDIEEAITILIEQRRKPWLKEEMLKNQLRKNQTKR